jgi:drug/metabolite transporter (DMT)-like permease
LSLVKIVNRKTAVALLVLANVLWGTSYVVAKVALEEVPPPLLGALRVILASAMLWPILIWRTWAERPSRRRLIEPIALGDALRLGGLGLLGIGASYLLDYWGISLSTATDASLMIIGEVIFTALLAALIAHERLGFRKRAGVLVGIAGVLLLVLGNAPVGQAGASSWARAAGDGLILACLLCESIYTVLGAGLARRYQPLTVLTLANTGSLLLWVPILLWYGLTGRFPALSLAAMAGVIYLAAVTSALCYLIWFSVLRVAGSSVGAISLFVQPLVGSLLGLALLGDPLTAALLGGAALIFVALYLMTVPERTPAMAAVLDDPSGAL